LYRMLTKTEIDQIDVPIPPCAQVIGFVNDSSGDVEVAVGVFKTYHLDPLWVKPSIRGRCGFKLFRLWKIARSMLRSIGADFITSSISCGHENEKIVERLSTKLAGGKELHSRVWVISVQGE